MKSLSASLQAHLDSGTTTLAWCWRIGRADGVVFGFTDHDRPLEFGGVTYEPESGFAASEIRSGADLAVDAQDAEGVLTSDTITETDILDGRWTTALQFTRQTSTAALSQRPSRMSVSVMVSEVSTPSASCASTARSAPLRISEAAKPDSGS